MKRPRDERKLTFVDEIASELEAKVAKEAAQAELRKRQSTPSAIQAEKDREERKKAYYVEQEKIRKENEEIIACYNDLIKTVKNELEVIDKLSVKDVFAIYEKHKYKFVMLKEIGNKPIKNKTQHINYYLKVFKDLIEINSRFAAIAPNGAILPSTAISTTITGEDRDIIEEHLEDIGAFRNQSFLINNLEVFPNQIKNVEPEYYEKIYKKVISCLRKNPALFTTLPKGLIDLITDTSAPRMSNLEHLFLNVPTVFLYLTNEQKRFCITKHLSQFGTYLMRHPEALDDIPAELIKYEEVKYMFIYVSKESVLETLGKHIEKHQDTIGKYVKEEMVHFDHDVIDNKEFYQPKYIKAYYEGTDSLDIDGTDSGANSGGETVD